MKSNDRLEAIKKVKKLFAFLKKHSVVSKGGYNEKDGSYWFDHSMPSRDVAHLSIKKDNTIEITSWLESYHNGDFYDEKEHVLTADDEMLEISNLEKRLTKEANAVALNCIRGERASKEEFAAKVMVLEFMVSDD